MYYFFRSYIEKIDVQGNLFKLSLIFTSMKWLSLTDRIIVRIKWIKAYKSLRRACQ